MLPRGAASAPSPPRMTMLADIKTADRETIRGYLRSRRLFYIKLPFVGRTLMSGISTVSGLRAVPTLTFIIVRYTIAENEQDDVSIFTDRRRFK